MLDSRWPHTLPHYGEDTNTIQRSRWPHCTCKRLFFNNVYIFKLQNTPRQT